VTNKITITAYDEENLSLLFDSDRATPIVLALL